VHPPSLQWLTPITTTSIPTLNGRAPQHVAVHCVPLSSQIHIRYAERNLLHVPRHRLDTYGRIRGFCRCWSIRLEQSSGPCLQTELQRSCFQAPARDISVTVHMVLAHQRIRGIGVPRILQWRGFTWWRAGKGSGKRKTPSGVQGQRVYLGTEAESKM